MPATVKRGKCYNCCPDGGAIFELVYRDGADKWQCRNCGHTIIKRQYAPTKAITPSQSSVIDRVEALGWTVSERTMIGRNVFIKANNPNKNWILGDMFCGSIGSTGSYKFKLFRAVGPDIEITDESGIKVYLT